MEKIQIIIGAFIIAFSTLEVNVVDEKTEKETRYVLLEKLLLIIGLLLIIYA